MLRFTLLLAAIVLCCSTAKAAPPEIATELVAWWDSWHTNPDTPYYLTIPSERRGTAIIPLSYLPYLAQCRSELRAIYDDPSTSPAARQQAFNMLSHFNLLPRRSAPAIPVP